MTCTCSCECPLGPGDQIRSTKVHDYGDGRVVRINGACPQWLMYLSDYHAVFRSYAVKPEGLRFLSETTMDRSEFDREFERDPRRESYPGDDVPHMYPHRGGR